MATEISIVTPIYNRSEIFERTLKSIEKSNSQIFQYIVVSDGCDDFSNLKALIESYSTRLNVFLCRLNRNQGTCEAINFGVKHVSSEWVMFLGSDDEIDNQGLQLINTYLKNISDDVDFIYYSMYDSNMNVRPYKKPNNTLNLVNYLIHMNLVLGKDQELGVLIRRRVIVISPMPSNHAYEDRFHLDLVNKFNGIFLDIPLKKINKDAKVRASTPQMKIRNQTEYIKILGQTSGFLETFNLYKKVMFLHAPNYLKSIILKYFRRRVLLFRNYKKGTKVGNVMFKYSVDLEMLSYLARIYLIRIFPNWNR